MSNPNINRLLMLIAAALLGVAFSAALREQQKPAISKEAEEANRLERRLKGFYDSTDVICIRGISYFIGNPSRTDRSNFGPVIDKDTLAPRKCTDNGW